MKSVERWTRPEETREWVRATVAELKRPCAVLLSGPLGAGKTQIVRWFMEELGVKDAASPTFAILQEYSTAAGVVDHVDLYRLKSDADLESSGFWDLLERPQALLFVEWADRLPADVWPTAWRLIRVELKIETDGARSAEIAVRR